MPLEAHRSHRVFSPQFVTLLPTGTLMVFAVVSVALIWKRVYNRDLTFKQQQLPFWLINVMVLASIGEGRLHT